MSKCPFEIGDKVKCILGYGGELKEGDVYTVSKISTSQMTLMVEEIDHMVEEIDHAWWNWDRFEKAQIYPCKIWVETPEISEATQEWLFSQGCGWYDGPTACLLGSKALFVEEGGVITHQYSEREYFDNDPRPEIKVTPRIEYSFDIVEELVEFNGKKYNKKKLEEALSLLEPEDE